MNKIRILIVDDDVPLTQTMKINLEDTGDFAVHVENNALKAISAAREFLPDIILLDVIMPGLDGGDVSAQLKSDPALSGIPVIMVTALVSNGETGAEGVVTSGERMMVAKPIRVDKLIEVIEKRLAKAV